MSEISTIGGKAIEKGDHDLSETTVQALMTQVGNRVRKAREIRGISRRALSETSGVSPRYLAQLEGGEGNISIGLLQRVAMALDFRIEWFIGTDDPWTSDAVQVTDLYRAADQNTQVRVMRLLNPAQPAEKKGKRICLVGLRGAGKSTLGQAASAALNIPFVELNKEIETHGGMPVSEIMALYGQEGYRKLESEAVDRVTATHDQLILAVAGGIVAEPATYQRLLARFHTVWVKANPQDHMDRVRAQGDERPMAGNPEAMAQLRALLTSREAMYDQAETKLDTSGKTKETSLAELLALIKEHRFLR